MRVVSVRPPMIYGPGMRGNPWRLFRLVATGVPLPFASVHNARTIAFVGNVVAHMADLLCLRSPTRASTYLVGDDAPVSTPQLVREIANALHVRARLFPVPMLALHATARAGDVIGRALPVGFNSDALRAMTGDLVLDTSAFRRDVGTPQRFSRELSLGLTARWFQIAQSPSDRAT